MPRTHNVIWFLFALISGTALADADQGKGPFNQKATVDKVQRARAMAEKLASDGTEVGIAKAIAIEEEQLKFLEHPDIRELALGNDTLIDREVDVRLDLAKMYAKRFDGKHALEQLENVEIRANAPSIADDIGSSAEFQFLYADPKFQAFLSRSRSPKTIWKGKTLSSAYKAELSLEERIAGLSDFWARARSGFAHFDNIPDLDWNQKYLEFLGKVEKTKSIADYYDVLMRFAPLLRDGHTNIYPPEELASHFYSRPPITTDLIQGKVIVTSILDRTIATKIHKGDEILAVDGEEVHTYANERVLPYVSSSTPQDRDVRLYSYQLLFGDSNQPVRLKIQTSSGEKVEVTLARSGYQEADNLRLNAFEFKKLTGNIAYLSLGEFEDDGAVILFNRHLAEIMKSDGLILDLRENGGGNTKFGLDILSYLTAQLIPIEYSRYRVDDGYVQYKLGQNGIFYWRPIIWQNPDVESHNEHYNGKVVVLVGPKTFSAAEDFLVSFDVLKRGVMIGQISAGSTGQPAVFNLPGGGTARICVKDDRFPDGRKFVGVGIEPQIKVEQTIADFRAGRDTALEAAIEYLAQ